MNLDVRIPISLLFAILGLIITVCGVVLPPEVYHKSLDININLIWGLVLIGFSGFMQLWIFTDKLKKDDSLTLEEQKSTLLDKLTLDTTNNADN